MSSITVFIIDANESTQHALSRLMRAAGFRVFCTGSVNELLRLERPASNAVILADVDTTRLFAETLPRCLHDKSQALPVIYLTDYDTEYMRKEARRMGAVGYFRKPIDDQALLDSITFAVRQSKVRNAG